MVVSPLMGKGSVFWPSHLYKQKTPGAAQGWRRTRHGNRTFQPLAYDTNPEDGYMDVAVCSIFPCSGQEAGDIKGFQGSPPGRRVPRGWRRFNPLALEVQEDGLCLLSAIRAFFPGIFFEKKDSGGHTWLQVIK
jgi:hypothetical protein